MRGGLLKAVAAFAAAPCLALAADPVLTIEAGGHTSAVRALQFSHDGRWLVSAGDDKVVRVWDVQAGRTAWTLRGEVGPGQAGFLYALAISPDDRYVAVGGNLAGDTAESHAVRIHDFRSGEVVRLLKGHEDVVGALAFSPDGRWLASASGDKTVRLWEVSSWKAARTWMHGGQVYAVAWSGEGSVASGSFDRVVRVWTPDGSKPTRTLSGHANAISSIVFAAGARYLVTSSQDKTVRIWDLAGGGAPRVIDADVDAAAALAVSPDGQQFVVSGNSEMRRFWCDVRLLPDGKRTARFDGHREVVLAAAVSPDGRTVASGGKGTEILLWNLRTGRLLRRLSGLGRPVRAVAFRSDGRAIAFGSRSYAEPRVNAYGPIERTFTLQEDGEATLALGGEPRQEDFTGAITTREDFALQTLRTRVGSFEDYAVLKVLKGGKDHAVFPPRDAASGYRHSSFTFTPDGRKVISGGLNGTLSAYLVSQPGRKPEEFVGHTGEVLALAVSPDGGTLVSGSDDQTIRMWDIATRTNLLTIFVAEDEEWIAFTPEGYYASSVRGDNYVGWQLNRGAGVAARYFAAAQFQREFYRPELVFQRLRSRTAQRAGPKLAGIEPPEIRITTRPSQQSGRAVVRVELSSSSLPITAMRVFVNGNHVPAPRLTGARSQSFEVEALLRPGENSLYVTAAHAKATARGAATIQGPRTAKEELKRLSVLAIGINEYKNRSIRLRYPEKDASELVAALKKQEGIRYSNVVARVLRSSEAGRDEVFQAVKWLDQEVSEGATGVLFLAGHGGFGRSSYYLYSRDHRTAVDTPDTAVDLSWAELLWTLFASGGARSRGKTIVLLDACYAGRAGRDARFVEMLKNSAELDGAVFAYAAAGPQDPAFEEDSLGHGFFTAALLDALARGNPGEPLYSDELAVRIRQRVQEYNAKYDRFQRSVHFTLPIGMPAEVLFAVTRR